MVVDPTKKCLPPAVGEIFEPLRNEITYLHGNWHVYQQVFHDPDSDEAIKVTPQGFAMIRYTMRHEIIMCLCRVTDPKTTQRTKENLTIAQLHHVVAQNCADSAFLAELSDLGVKIDAERKPFNDIRNRTLAHLDLLTFLNDPSKPLPKIDWASAQRCIEMLAQFMNMVLGHYTTIHCDFVPHISPAARNIVHNIKEYRRWLPEIHMIEKKRSLDNDGE